MKRINFIKNIEQDEIRSGFLVTTDRKKIWQKEMEILQIVDSICDKYGIQYYIDGGTLLGAVRHGGFIPWDDDIDLVMLRPDYNRFQEIAIKEVVYPYFFRSNYTDKRILPMCKVVDERTSAIEYVDDFELHQGIFVDIFPVDVAEDGSEYNREIIRQANELWSMIVSPQYLFDQIENGIYVPSLSYEVIKLLGNQSKLEKVAYYDQFMQENFKYSTMLNIHVISQINKSQSNFKREWYEDVCSMNFEGVYLPAPIGYEGILNSYYGNWHKLVKGGSAHEGIIMSADVPYKEYLKQCNDGEIYNKKECK